MTSREGISVLIQAGRSILSSQSSNRPSAASATVERWMHAGSPLLRRLAVDAIRQAAWMNPDEKLMWLLDNELLYEASTKHEVFQVLATAFPEASEAARTLTLKRVKRGVRAKDEPRLSRRTRDYERYNLAYWLSTVAPEDKVVQDLFRREQERNADFATRVSPDLEVGDIQASFVRSSVTTEDLLKKRAGDIRVAKALIAFRDPADISDQERYSFLGVVGQAVATKPEWGLRLARSLVRLEAWDSDLWKGLTEGWSRANATDRVWTDIYSLLDGHPRPRVFAHEAGRLLIEFIGSHQTTESGAVRAAEDFSETLWDALHRDPGDLELRGVDWLTAAINEPGGKLAEFWLRLLSARAREVNGSGIAQRDRDRFASVLSGQHKAAVAGRIVLASQFHFLLAADREWATSNLLPLFDWNLDEHRAEQVWQGFLVWGQLNEAVIDKMLPLYVETFPRLDDRDAEWRRRFTDHLALIALRSTRNPIEDGWLVPFVTRTSVVSRSEWASHVAFLLRSLESDGKRVQWEKWIRRYWTDRLSGIPRRLARQEVGEMSAWAASLEAVFEEAVGLLVRGPSGGAEAYVYDLVGDGVLPEEYPQVVLRFLSHTLTGEDQPFYSCHEVVPILQRIRTREHERRDFEGVVDQLVGLGCQSALKVLD